LSGYGKMRGRKGSSPERAKSAVDFSNLKKTNQKPKADFAPPGTSPTVLKMSLKIVLELAIQRLYTNYIIYGGV